MVWVAVSYIIGVIFHQPEWYRTPQKSVREAYSANTQRPLPVQAFKKEKFRWLGNGLVTLWFDDGWVSQYTNAYPLLKQYGYTGAFAITVSYVDGTGYMTWNQIRSLYMDGWEVTDHSRTHNCDVKHQTEQQLESEIVGSLEDLKEKGFSVDHYVAPCGTYSDASLKLVRQYYLSFRGAELSDSGINPLPVPNPYALSAETVRSITPLDEVNNWIQSAKANHSWLILMFHKVDNSGGLYSIPKDRLRKVLDMIKQADLTVVLPTQALQVQAL